MQLSELPVEATGELSAVRTHVTAVNQHISLRERLFKGREGVFSAMFFDERRAVRVGYDQDARLDRLLHGGSPRR